VFIKVDIYILFINFLFMNKKNFNVKEVTENYFLRDNKKIKIVFSYDYFEDFILRNWLEEIFSKKLYLDWFDFEIVKLSQVDFNLDLENPDFISKLQTNRETYISEWLLYLGNDKSRRFWFFFFPNYFDDWEVKNDFISIYSNEEIDLTDYVTFRWLFKRDGIIIALKI